MYLYTPTECKTSRVSSNINYGHWVIMICHDKSINFNNFKSITTLLSDVDNGEDFTCVGIRVIREISVPPSQSYCKPKSTLI